MQMGDQPAKGFNDGIIYLMIVPYIAIGIVAYKWWQNEKRKSWLAIAAAPLQKHILILPEKNI